MNIVQLQSVKSKYASNLCKKKNMLKIFNQLKFSSASALPVLNGIITRKQTRPAIHSPDSVLTFILWQEHNMLVKHCSDSLRAQLQQ